MSAREARVELEDAAVFRNRFLGTSHELQDAAAHNPHVQ
jgi:hypothetical protein